MNNISIQIVINDKVADRHSAFDALPNSIKAYSERVAHNAQLLFLKLIEKGIYDDYTDLNIKNAKYIFDVMKYFDVGYAFESGENTYSGKAIPMQHVQLGSEVFFSDIKTREDFKALSEEERFIRRKGKDAAFYHHERWDGHGYPEGLRMEEIPIMARICSICYAFESYTFPNSKNVRLSKSDAIKQIVEESSKAYDPLIVEVFATLENELVVEGDIFEKRVEVKDELESPSADIQITKTIDENKENIFDLEEEMHKPIEMLYTPIVNIEDNKTLYYQSEMILFDEYIGELKPPVYGYVAEKTGQIVKLTELGLNNVLYALKIINKYDNDKIKLSMRIYESHIKRPSFLNSICSIIDNSKIGYDQIVLEIPEESFLNVDDYVFESISELRRKGVKIVLIDFGIGYSSMSNLSEIEFDYAIVPKKLINQITTSTKTGGMVRGFLELIKQLDAKAICEGVETAQQYDILKKYGYTLMSGTYFSNILNEDNLIRRHRGKF